MGLEEQHLALFAAIVLCQSESGDAGMTTATQMQNVAPLVKLLHVINHTYMYIFGIWYLYNQSIFKMDFNPF